MAIVVAIVALLLGGAVAVLPLLVDSAAVRRVVEREISARVGGKVRYDSIGLRLFPLPRAKIRGVTVHSPDALTGRAAVIDVELSLASLLGGSVRPTAVRVEQPVLEVRIAPGGGADDPFAAYRETLGPIVETLAREAPGMSVTIVDGQVAVLRDSRRVVALSKLAAQADVAADAIDVRVSGAADRWQAAEGRLRIVPGSLAGSATLQVKGLQARGLLEAMGTDGALAVHPGAVDARLEAQADGLGALRAALDASSPELVLERGARQLAVGTVRVAAEVARDPKTLMVSLRRLELGDVVPGATGTLRANADGTAPALTLELSALDLVRLRESALLLAGDVEGVRAVADVVRAGTLRSVTIVGAASTFAALAGAIRPTAVRVEQPVFEVRLGPGGGPGKPFAAYREALGPIVETLVRVAPGLSVTIVDGRLAVLRDRRPVVALSKLAAQADVAAAAIAVRVSGAADRWRAAEGRLRIVPGSLAGSATLQVKGLQARGLLEAMGTDGALAVHPGAVDARLEAETDGYGAGRATISASSPQLVVARGPRRLELGAARVAADVTRDPKTLTVSLRRLELGDLLPGATGTLRAHADGTAPALELAVATLDLARLRAGALVLGDDAEGVRAVAAIVRAGTLRSLRITGAGGTFAALTESRTIRAEGGLDGGAVDLPDLGIAVRDGRGPLVFANGALRGSELSGKIGTSSFRDGALALELVPAVSLQSMRATVDADLTEALAIARRSLDPAGAAALADIEALQGRGAGSIAFERRGRQPSYGVELTSVRATGRYRGVPFPLAVSSGEVRYAPDALRVRGLSATVGRSRLTGAAADLARDAQGTVGAASGEAVLELDELYPWLASLDRLRPALKDVSGVTGTAALRLARASGPLARPAALDFEATVRPHEVRAVLPALPAPLTLAGGEARVTPSALRLDRVGATLLDARVTVSGSVEDYASPDRRLALTLAAGEAGGEAFDWLRKRWQIDPAALPRPPVALDAGRLHWSAAESSERSAQGTLRLSGDARAEIDLTWGPETFHLRRFALKDADSDATGSLRWAPSRAFLAFAGRIDHRSLVRIMARPPEALTSLQGNLRAQIDLAEPRHSMAAGTLAGEGLDVLDRWGMPVSIERVRVDASGDAMTIRDGIVKLAGQRAAVDGRIAMRPETFAVDLRLTADRIDADQLLRALPRRTSKGGGWSLPMEGRVAVTAKSIAFAERIVESIAGTVRLAPNRAVVELSEANLCGVAVPFTATLTPDAATISGRVVARGAPLDTVLPCFLRSRDLVMTGRLDVDAEFSAVGPPAELAQRLSGAFRGRARAGNIQHERLGPRILALEHVAARVEADQAARAAARGFDYSEIAVVGTLDARRARLERFTLDARMLGLGVTGEVDLADGQLALRGVVAPFGRATAALRRVPVLGRLFGARIVGVPFSVHGDWHDPRVIPLRPEAIAGTFLDLLSRALNAPIELLNPRRPFRERTP